MKGFVQQPRKWLFSSNFFSSSKWAQFLHVTLDLTGKHCPVIFPAVLFFFVKKFSWTSTDSIVWKNKSFLWKGHCQEKKLRFCIRYLWKMKEKPANLNRGVCFSMKWKATCKNWAHLEEKKFGLKSHLRSCCRKPFKCNSWSCNRNLELIN